MYAVGELGNPKKKKSPLLKYIGIGAGVVAAGAAAYYIAPKLLPTAGGIVSKSGSDLLQTAVKVAPKVLGVGGPGAIPGQPLMLPPPPVGAGMFGTMFEGGMTLPLVLAGGAALFFFMRR